MKDCLFTQMKEGDELIIININEEKSINLIIIGQAGKGLKMIKEKINTYERLNNNKKRDMLLIDDSILKFGPIDVPNIIAYLSFLLSFSLPQVFIFSLINFNPFSACPIILRFIFFSSLILMMISSSPSFIWVNKQSLITLSEQNKVNS